MKEQIPEYYILLNKGKTLASSERTTDVLQALSYLEKAFELKQTFECFSSICDGAIKIGDKELYEEYLLKGIDLGFDRCFYSLGRLYIKTDIDKGIFYLEKAIEKGIVQACVELSSFYAFGNEKISPNADKSLKYLLKGLEINNPDYNGMLHNMLGIYFHNIKYFDNAFIEFSKASELGFKPAYFNLAMAYKYGEGTEVNIDKYAEYLFKDLNADSTYEIGGVYLTGKYAPVDMFMAKLYFRYSASFKNPSSAIMYAACLVSEKNYDEKEVFKALDIAFQCGKQNKTLKENFYNIEEFFPKEISDTLFALAEKYWDLKKNQA